MGGRMSRNKGKRAEYLVRDYVRSLGYHDAVRVPLSGASEGFKGDVVYTDKHGKKITIEVKSRKNSFNTIYKKYLNMVLHHPTLGPITIFEALPDYIFTKETNIESKRDIKYFETLYKLKAGADMLVVKDNNKPLVFLHFEIDKRST